MSYKSLPRVSDVYPLFGYADAENFTSSITVNGVGFTSLDKLYFGDYSVEDTTTTSASSITGVIYNFNNISYLDSSSPFGDYKTSVEVGLEDWGQTKDEVAYTFIKHFEIINMEPSLVDSAGDTLYINGTGLI